MIFGDGETLDACVLDKRYGDAYKMVCIHACEDPDAPPNALANRVFQGKYDFPATDKTHTFGISKVEDGTLSSKYNKKCHSTSWRDSGCIDEIGRLNTRVPVCAQWYHAPKEGETPLFNSGDCQKCAEWCKKDPKGDRCMKEYCRLGISQQDTNEEPFDYIHAAKMAVAFNLVAERVREAEESKSGYRRKMQKRAHGKKDSKRLVTKPGLAVDAYGRALLRKVRMLENVGTFIRIKSKR